MTLGLEIYTLFTLHILKLKPNSNYQLNIYVYKLIPLLANIIMTNCYEWQGFTFTSCSLAWEIATSPTEMHGRSAAQPRVGTHKWWLFQNYLRYWSDFYRM